MTFIAWIALGLISGFIASALVNRRGEGIFRDIVLGIAGALVGGVAFNLLGIRGVTGLNLWSMVVSVTGAVLVLVTYHAVIARRRFI